MTTNTWPINAAAQRLNLSSRRGKQQEPAVLPPQEPSLYPTNFSRTLQLSPPAAPPCLLRALGKAKENPGMGKVKVMLRLSPSLEASDGSESQSFLKVDSRKKQLTLYDPASSGPASSGPASSGPASSGPARRITVAVPKMFAFDAVFTQDASQAEVCSGTVAEVIQSVVNGADGCVFCFGHVKLGKTFTMIGRDASSQTLGVAPCAISWLFKLIGERKEKTSTRFSVRVSAVEICGQEEELKDLLSEVSSGSLRDGQSPGIYLREDPICGTQLQNQTELRAPTAEKAALFLDAAVASRSTSRPGAGEEDRRTSHMLFTLHLYQYRMEKNSKGGMSGGRSRLHLIDLGSCEKSLSKTREGGGGGLCLSLNALGNVIMALANGAKHVPYRDSKLTMLLQESLGNINCRTTMIAHISDSPAHYAASLSTIQLASRIHRMRKKKSKYASSSSGGDSSCEEGRVRRPPHLRPFHPRTVALDPDLPSLLSDPDYSSSSEQSCDTVIYVGPGGAAVSDRELSDNEGPPSFVPIIPSLNRRRGGRGGPLDRDTFFKCNTFAELQERLECIDGSEEPAAFVGEGGRGGAQGSPKTKEGQGSVSPKTVPKGSPPSSSSSSSSSGGDSTSPKHTAAQRTSSPLVKTQTESKRQGAASPSAVCRSSADGEKVLPPETGANPGKKPGPPAPPSQQPGPPAPPSQQPGPTAPPSQQPGPPAPPSQQPGPPAPPSQQPGPPAPPSQQPGPPAPPSQQPGPPAPPSSEPVVREKVYFNKKGSLPKAAPPPPRQGSSGEGWERPSTRMPPVGMSHQTAKRGDPSSIPSPSRREVLRATVTLQRPVELNGEDELVFTLVEELSLGRPGSMLSLGSDCSLCALPSVSRPVSIISSINDEFDAYTAAADPGSEVNVQLVRSLCEEAGGLGRGSWRSDGSLCTLASESCHSGDVFPPPSMQCGSDSSYLDALGLFPSDPSPRDPKSSLNDSGFSFSEVDSDSAASGKLSLSRCLTSPDSTKGSLRLQSKLAKVHSLSAPPQPPQPTTGHSSLPRKGKPTSSLPHGSGNARESPRQEAVAQGDPWQRKDSQSEPQLSNHSAAASNSRLPRNTPSGIPSRKPASSAVANGNSIPRRPLQASTSAQRVVDGCEKSPLSRVPQLRRGATTLGMVSSHDNVTVCPTTSLRFSSLGKDSPKPSATAPPPLPPVRKSSLDQNRKNLLAQSALKLAYGESPLRGSSGARSAAASEDELDVRYGRGDSGSLKTSSLRSSSSSRATSSSLKARAGRAEAGQQQQHYGSLLSLERFDAVPSSRPVLSRENSGASLASASSRSSRTTPRFGFPSSPGAPRATSPPSPGTAQGGLGKPGQAKASSSPRGTGGGAGGTVHKARSLAASGAKGLSASTKSLVAASSSSSSASVRPGRGTIMGTRQALRAANSRVSELASGKAPRGSADTEGGGGTESGASPPSLLPSPYSKITAPRRPQRYSSGHGSDNSSVLSGELPPAMGRTALFYHSGGSSGYESMIRDSEATGSASSAHDSMSESGASLTGRAPRASKAPKKRSNVIQRRRLIPAALPDTSSLGMKASAGGQWVGLPPMPGPLKKEPFEIKVYEIDDVERLQRRRQEETAEQPFQDVEKGLMYFNSKLKVLERRQQQIRDLSTKHQALRAELQDTKARLMMDPCKWIGEFEVDQELDKESQEYLEALVQVTEDLEFCVNLCKSRVMMVTCFDISTALSEPQQECPREVEV
ncbi:kinesin-like protein KIF26A [Aplochiton taeniatus]